MPDQRLQRPLDSLHRRLWSARSRRRLSRVAAAAALGISAKHLQRIENAQREPTVAQVAAAINLLRCRKRQRVGAVPHGTSAIAAPRSTTRVSSASWPLG